MREDGKKGVSLPWYWCLLSSVNINWSNESHDPELKLTWDQGQQFGKEAEEESHTMISCLYSYALDVSNANLLQVRVKVTITIIMYVTPGVTMQQRNSENKMGPSTQPLVLYSFVILYFTQL